VRRFSNYGYTAWTVVTSASGMSLQTICRKTLLGPLGMTSSSFEVTEAERLAAIGYRWEKRCLERKNQ
jgi:CubicO group peptidase (beta-lactamase class C family)